MADFFSRIPSLAYLGAGGAVTGGASISSMHDWIQTGCALIGLLIMIVGLVYSIIKGGVK